MIRIPRKAAAIWLVVCIALAAVLAWRLDLLADLLPGAPPLRVKVLGHSWWWEFDYPELGIKTANELHVPAGTEIEMEVTSVDVIHTLSIPELSVKAVGIPGVVQTIELGALEVGQLGGECSEICGTAHGMMRTTVQVEAQGDFKAWVTGQQRPAAAPQTERQHAGYDMLTTACAKCHSLDPAEPRSDLLGPNLAHLMSRSVFAGASFTLDETSLRRWLRDTQAMKAGNDMVVKLPRDDYEAVIEYLLMLK